MPRKTSPLDRVYARCIPDGDCLICTMNPSRKEIQVHYEGRKVYASRLVLEQKIRRPLSPSELACHTCDNPRCMNPEHLFVGTNADNMKDRDHKKRNAVGERNGGAKLTQSDVDVIRSLPVRRGDRKEIADRFGVNPATISRIRKRQYWK